MREVIVMPRLSLGYPYPLEPTVLACQPILKFPGTSYPQGPVRDPQLPLDLDLRQSIYERQRSRD